MDTRMQTTAGSAGDAPSMRAGVSIAGILFLAAADMTIVSTLLPAIASSIGGEALFPWLMSIFMAAMALSGMCTGALADRFGIRAILTLAVSIFLGASAMAGLAPEIHILLLARLAQGIGAGMIIVLSYSALSLLYGLKQHGRAQGLIGLTWGVAAVVGPLLGIVALRYFSWRFLFLINVPVGVVCLAVFRTCFPKIEFNDQRRFDWPAQLAFGTLLFVGMMAVSTHSLGLSAQVLMLLLAIALAALMVLHDRVRRDPAIAPLPMQFLSQKPLIALVILVPCASMGLYAAITFLPLVLGLPQSGQRLPAGIAAAAGSFVVASIFCSRFIDRFGRRSVMMFGMLCLALGSLVLAGCVDQQGFIPVITAETLSGIGMGVVAVTAVVHAQFSAPEGQLSTYTSAVQVLRNIGAALGINLFAALQTITSKLSSAPSAQLSFLILALLLALCMVPASLLPGLRGRQANPISEAPEDEPQPG